MRALTVQPGMAQSARIEEVPEPPESDGALLLRTLALGVCGTDVEIVSGGYGWAPPGQERLILGHESLALVESAPAKSGFSPGDLVVGIVRRPDPVPCPNCRIGEWDMCRNGRYTERGIKERNGFAAERFRLEPDFAIPVDKRLGELGVLLEPASVLAKAWEHIERIGRRALWEPRRILVTGAGPVGLIAALFAKQRGYEVHVLDHATSGPKPMLVHDLGATYHRRPLEDLGFAPDVVVECTGSPDIVAGLIGRTAPGSIVCLAGVSSGDHPIPIDIAQFNRRLVLGNDAVFGSVNANRRHYEAAAKGLAEADPAWLKRLITRRVPLSAFADALHRRPDDVKAVIDFTL
jgi:glucose 1-dehydrogenase